MSASGYEDPPHPLSTVHTVEVDGETVLYNTATNRAIRLDVRASLIWKVLDGEVTVAELVDDLSEVFETDRGIVRSDLEHMLAELYDLGYLASADAAAGPAVAADSVLPDPPSP